ncbi:Hypothetical protein AT6N2_L2196 [Agrobacterium tumefaciens]|nr:Hypothetical protein AT6N2_L2196 [Agrobacterium tumefaciens]
MRLRTERTGFVSMVSPPHRIGLHQPRCCGGAQQAVCIAARRGEPADRPGIGNRNAVAATTKLGERCLTHRAFHHDFTRRTGARIKRARKMGSVEQRHVYGRLQVLAVVGITQEEGQLPLVLLVATGRAKDHGGTALMQRKRGCQRRARPFARCERGRQAFLQPEHLGAGVERETKARHDGRGLQPAARGRGGDHVTPAVNDIDMHGVTALFGQMRHGRLVDGALAAHLGQHRQGGVHLLFVTRHGAGPQFQRRLTADQRPTPGIITLGEKIFRWYLTKFRIAVIDLAVSKGELHGFDDGVDEIGTGGVHGRNVETFQKRQRLQENRPLPPGGRLCDCPVVIVECLRRFHGGAPPGHILRRQHALVPSAARIHYLCGADVTIDGFRHETPVESITRRLDLVFAAGARFGFSDDPLIGCSQNRITKIGMRLRRGTTRQPRFIGCRPFLFEEMGQPLDGGRDTRQRWMPVLGVIDGGFQHLAHAHRAVVAQHQHPSIEGAGDDCGEQPVAGDQLQSLSGVMPNRCATRGRALCADDFDLVLLFRIKHGRHIPAGAAQMRLDNLQDETGGDGGVEGIATPLEDCHTDRRGDPVG